ncbi:hypothetical protein L1887_34099 [Cichorium endivia]|nr:hypothetical protein L1887_34099 [Cichorium endivia]
MCVVVNWLFSFFNPFVFLFLKSWHHNKRHCPDNHQSFLDLPQTPLPPPPLQFRHLFSLSRVRCQAIRSDFKDHKRFMTVL